MIYVRLVQHIVLINAILGCSVNLQVVFHLFVHFFTIREVEYDFRKTEKILD